nr:ABC transporter ATP-binding protein [Alkalicoccus luteus]
MDIRQIQFLFEWIQQIPENYRLLFILTFYVFVVLVVQWLKKYTQLRHASIQYGFLHKVRTTLHEKILIADWGFHLQKKSSDIVHILLTETGKISSGTNAVLQLFSQALFTIIQIGIAFWLSPGITLFVLGAGVILMFFSKKFVRRSIKLGQRNFELGEQYMAGLNDNAAGIKEIKVNGLEDRKQEWYDNHTQAINNEQMAFLRLRSSSYFRYKVTSAVLIALFIFGALQFFQAQAAQLLLIVLIFSRLWPRVTTIQNAMEQIGAFMPAFYRVRKIEKEADANAENKLIASVLSPKSLIELRDVSFSYDSRTDVKALSHVSAEFPIKQTTAIVGKSGAGKSTLIDLLMGLHRPNAGMIVVDGEEKSSDYLLSLRPQMSYVSQDPHIFQGTIRNNLSLVKTEVTDFEMWEALRFAAADEFVQKLPDGLDTELGDRGVRLSGGERQRLVLARAILRQTPVLILDEATSALDSDNEQKIQQALENMRGRMTVIVIAHRLSTIRHADQVLVLEGGRVIQQGGYQTLAREQNGAFHELLQKQQV